VAYHRGATRVRAPQIRVPGRKVVAVTSDDTTTVVETPGRKVVVQRLTVPIDKTDAPIANAWTYYQYARSASWSFTHPLGRTPIVSVFALDGSMIDADMQTTITTITVTFNVPVAGYVLVT
jgi:hypothetical protein